MWQVEWSSQLAQAGEAARQWEAEAGRFMQLQRAAQAKAGVRLERVQR